MKLALQYEMQRPSLDDHLVLSETLEQCVLADEVGFDYLWLVEHHFLTGFSASPCPDLIFAALSQRTKRIRLGLGVVILPYHHPNRVAERVAMLDHLSDGRVDFGTGRSAPYELTGMGIDPRDSREMWEESLTIVPKIWSSDWFEYEGKYWQIPSRQILPKPYQDPHPPIWVAALQPATYDIAAEKGIGVLAFGSSAPESLAPYVKAYKDKVKNANPVGGFINGQWASSTLGICLENNKEARYQTYKSSSSPSTLSYITYGESKLKNMTYNQTFEDIVNEININNPNEVTISLNTSGPQFLAISEIFYPNGWHATINGVKTDIFQVNDLIRGININDKGSYMIRMWFDPSDLKWGKALSYIGFSIIFILIIPLH